MRREQVVVQRARQAFRTGRTRPLEFRIQQLKGLQSFIKERKKNIAEALKKDLGKCELGGELFETLVVDAELKLVIERLAEWAAPRPVERNLLTLLDEVYVMPQPRGVVLILGAWNYPWSLTLLPMIGAIAAGNAAILKPSDMSPNSSEVLEEYLSLYLDRDLYPVVTGGVPETQELLRLRFDHVFYTGSPTVGKLVMEAAARHLTPVTLELGGKSPCYIDKDCNISVACRRIAWGKFINCGQTCIAPDYILCESSIQDRVLEEITKNIKEFYTDNPMTSEDYGRIINQRQFKRLVGLMEGTTVVFGGDADETQNYIGPTLLKNVTGKSKVMQEEIFGPLLPIITVAGLDEAIEFINEREKPLVLYVYSNDRKLIKRVITETSSGALLANDCIVHFIDSALPFGGVGYSGMGHYRGRHSFDQLSHLRSCMIKPFSLEVVNNMRYPPHTVKKVSWARFFLLTPVRWLRRMVLFASLAGLAAFVVQEVSVPGNDEFQLSFCPPLS
ncbi:aldehyde dehydrogenase family 3 member A2-like [Xenentodon cancila]